MNEQFNRVGVKRWQQFVWDDLVMRNNVYISVFIHFGTCDSVDTTRYTLLMNGRYFVIDLNM